MMDSQIKFLIDRLRGTPVQVAIESARELAFSADESIVPTLFNELALAQQEFQCQIESGGIDVSEERRPQAIEMAIVSLLPPEKSLRMMLERKFSNNWIVERRQHCKSLQEF